MPSLPGIAADWRVCAPPGGKMPPFPGFAADFACRCFRFSVAYSRSSSRERFAKGTPF